ncbi:hypothetical protein NDU88_001985 [Pleurodeles waltl]|uniref:Uncharacterized protein n=1 Tax=Pleurodeles waltl TaxID=8319 RepID=A0AAV7UUE5_PLEWA|nr:hypothetical protein NDU88_001985 [Pleurodeles waltl]
MERGLKVAKGSRTMEYYIALRPEEEHSTSLEQVDGVHVEGEDEEEEVGENILDMVPELEEKGGPSQVPCWTQRFSQGQKAHLDLRK